MLAISQASEAIIRLDSQGVTLTNTEPLARLLMRSEAVASSRIEGLSMSAKRLLEHEALVEIGVTPRPNSTEAAILANIQIMHEHVFSAHHGDPIDLALLKRINAKLLADGPLKDHGGIVRTEQNWIGGSALDPVGASYIPPCRRRCLGSSTTFCASAIPVDCPPRRRQPLRMRNLSQSTRLPTGTDAPEEPSRCSSCGRVVSWSGPCRPYRCPSPRIAGRISTLLKTCTAPKMTSCAQRRRHSYGTSAAPSWMPAGLRDLLRSASNACAHLGWSACDRAGDQLPSACWTCFREHPW